MYDVIVVGGGPAGLSAALVLGRCRRKVLVCDDGRYRNSAARAVHGFLSRDGLHPAELRRIGREQLERYEIELRTVRVADARHAPGGFAVTLEDGAHITCRKLLLATGVVDSIPQVVGMDRFYGCGVFHCPYCDGWEVRDQPLAVYGRGKNAATLALSLKTWSDEIVLCSDGPAGLKREQAGALRAAGIPVHEQRIASLEGRQDRLEEIVLQDGSRLACRALFLSTSQDQRSDLAARLGCSFTSKGAVRTGKLEGTTVNGVYVAGDASHDVQLAIVAAAEGARAAIAINKALHEEKSLSEESGR